MDGVSVDDAEPLCMRDLLVVWRLAPFFLGDLAHNYFMKFLYIFERASSLN